MTEPLDDARGELLALAEVIHKARWPDGRLASQFADEDSNGREYCFRIARAVLRAAPARRDAESVEAAAAAIADCVGNLLCPPLCSRNNKSCTSCLCKETAKAAIAALVPPPSIIEQCAKIAQPWAGYWLDKYSTDADRAVVAVRTEIADKIRALSPDQGTVTSGPTAEDIRACAWSTLIGWQHELGDSIDFICDQIARKATMPAVSSTHQGAARD